jgi:hypothetical protein
VRLSDRSTGNHFHDITRAEADRIAASKPMDNWDAWDWAWYCFRESKFGEKHGDVRADPKYRWTDAMSDGEEYYEGNRPRTK